MKTVVLISGIARSGKDTLAKQIIDEYTRPYRDWREWTDYRIAFADGVKSIAFQCLDVGNAFSDTFKTDKFQVLDLPIFKDWDKNTLPTGRDILIRFAEGMKKLIGDDVWADMVVNQLLDTTNTELIIIPDLRFQVEKDTVVKAMSETDVKVVHIHIVDVTRNLRIIDPRPQNILVIDENDGDVNKMLNESLNVFNQNETANDDLPLWKSADYFVYSTKTQPIELHHDFIELINNSKPDSQA